MLREVEQRTTKTDGRTVYKRILICAKLKTEREVEKQT